MQQLPHKIARYIRECFHEPFIVYIKKIKDKETRPLFKVKLNENDTSYLMEFNRHGRLTEKRSEPTYGRQTTGMTGDLALPGEEAKSL
jgi:hypothetical protein